MAGRAPPRNTTVDLNSGNIDVPPNMACWASFHNGVAAGLKIAPASQIDSAWIVYNKPKIAELANEYAGFLMALGLNGHLTKLATLNIHDYLTKVSPSGTSKSQVPLGLDSLGKTRKEKSTGFFELLDWKFPGVGEYLSCIIMVVVHGLGSMDGSFLSVRKDFFP